MGNLFAQEEMAGYPTYQTAQNQAANSQTGAVYDDHEMKRYSHEKGDYWGDPLGAQKWQAEENRRQQQQTQPMPKEVLDEIQRIENESREYSTPGIAPGKWDSAKKAHIDPNSSTAGMDYLNSLYTSPQEEERLRKASVMNQRILAIGDAIRHIGNIANTVNYAPAQQLNSPVQEEQARYERGKALRDRANQTYLAYQQQKAAQDAKARQWAAEQKQKADQWNATFKFNAAKAAADLAERKRQYDQTAEFNREKQKANEARWERQDKETRRHHGAVEANSRAGLAETIRHHKQVEANGGTAKGSFPVKSPFGKMRVPGRSIPQAQMNQAYKDFENAGWIKQGEFAKRMRDLGVGAKADPDYVRNRMVEEIIAGNGTASDYMRDNFGWEYEDDPRGTGEMLMQQEGKPQPLYYAPWSSNLGNPFEERQQPTSSNNHKINPFG